MPTPLGPAVARRDRALRRLRRMTVTIAVGAVLAVGGFSVLASAAKPGISTAGSQAAVTAVQRPPAATPAPRHHRRAQPAPTAPQSTTAAPVATSGGS